MAALVRLQLNPDSTRMEVLEYTVIPKNKRPAIIPEGYIYIDQLPPRFVNEWYKFYLLDGQLVINDSRVSIEACQGV